MLAIDFVKRSNLPVSLSDVTHILRATNASGSVLFDPITSAQAEEILSWLSHVYASPAIEEPISKTYDPAATTYGDIGYAQWVGDFQLYSFMLEPRQTPARTFSSFLARYRGFLLLKSIAAMLCDGAHHHSHITSVFFRRVHTRR